MKKTLPTLLALSAAITLAGCGGGNNDNAGAASQRITGTSAIEPRLNCEGAECNEIGGFTKPFVEPWGPSVMRELSETGEMPRSEIEDPLRTPKGNLKNPLKMVPQDDRCLRMADGRPTECKPAAGSIALLEDNRVLYFNALEGTEDAEFSIFFEAGTVVTNDQTRVMTLNGNEAGWMRPSPIDGGATNENRNTLLKPFSALLGSLPLGIDTGEDSINNDGALFCADLSMLADGRVMAVGGTDYYFEPGISAPIAIGLSELEGVRNARVFDPRNNSWSKTGDMNFGRWYPSLTTLPDGNVFVSSGVTKLVKPVYLERPLASGRNVVETETYNLGCGTWTDNGGLAQRSLPLYPRHHLLPNGHVLYNAAGQAFNPFGQAYDQALWNIVSAYDPVNKLWTDLGYAGLPLRLNELGLERLGSALNPTNPNAPADVAQTVTGLLSSLTSDPMALLSSLESLPREPQALLSTLIGAGFRGSTFSVQLPLRPNAEGRYDNAEFLTGGGVLGLVTANSPGSYVTTDTSRIDRINIDADDSMSYESRVTGNMTTPRWYGTGVLLPTGQVMVFSGADRDEVVLPGTGAPILRSEMFDPATETWKPMATQHNPRTYHNTAILLPDGRVLIGGHSPINTAYAFSINIPGLSPNDGRDPSFEIYNPPYMFQQRPAINSVANRAEHGQSLNVATPDAADIVEVVMVRRTTLTHIVDGDQRTVVLPITSRTGNSLTVKMPEQKAVLPPGPYMMFVITERNGMRVPSESKPVRVTGADTTCRPDAMMAAR
ncbi:MAG: galactose oxidase early set domain-containing protein [Moraxellaceae bacterium]|nr:galactose oxidase early set domain-containing protein [Moraxellaceae bacterium]